MVTKWGSGGINEGQQKESKLYMCKRNRKNNKKANNQRGILYRAKNSSRRLKYSLKRNTA